jgi:FkbM family methyltransferase
MRSPAAIDSAAAELASQQALDQQYERWMKNFKAADPSYQDFCEGALRMRQGNGQYQQDMYLFFNIFKYWPMQGKVGYFVDSGTNEPLEMNNSLFYEKCLGWGGICVEPQTKYHDKIEATRNCHLFKGCLASKSMTAVMEGLDGVAKVVQTDDAEASNSVQCVPLKDILASQGRSSIDFWSLDVEGAEIDVLSSFDFDDVPVRALLIEDFWVTQRDIDYLVTSKGFIKYRQLAVDSLYLSKTTKYLSPVWEPPNLDGDWMFNKQFRTTVKDQLPIC